MVRPWLWCGGQLHVIIKFNSNGTKSTIKMEKSELDKIVLDALKLEIRVRSNCPPPNKNSSMSDNSKEGIVIPKEHTPGPWYPHVYNGQWEISTSPEMGTNQVLHNEAFPEAPMNAILCATAPDLLRQLQETNSLLERILGRHILSQSTFVEIQQAVDDNAKTIKAAKGQ